MCTPRDRLEPGRDDPDREAGAPESGFVLLESLITIALITVIMTALTTFFITTISSTAKQRSQQSAIQIANTAVELARGVGAAGAVTGRDAGSVNAQMAGVVANDVRVAPWLTAMTPATGPGGSATLPTTAVTRQLGTNTFGVNYFVGWCWRSGADSATSAACAATQTVGTIQYVRSVVAVTWPDNQCTNRQCVYVTATLLNGSLEPTFNFNAAPTSPPSLTCVQQTSAVGEPVARSVLASTGPPVVPGCTTAGGVPAFTYSATGLPAGLVMASDGTVTGTASGPAGNAAVLLTVRDSFLRTATTSFTWTVLSALVLTAPGAQSSPVGPPVAPVSGSASGGSGAPYTWAATGLPDGLVIGAGSGRMTGSPTRNGSYTVTLTVTDSSGTRTAQSSFAWTVAYPPLVLTQPANQVTRVNTPVNVALASSGGSGSVTWSDPGGSLPAGLRISGSSVIGTPTATVSNRQVTLTATDAAAGKSQSTTFTWTVTNTLATSYANRTDTVGTTLRERSGVPSLTLAATGGQLPYTWSSTALPRGVSLSSAGVLSGTPSATGSTSVTFTVRDAAGGTATATVTWAVVAAPTVTRPPDPQTDQLSTVSLPTAATCPNGPCSYAVTAGALPAGLSLNSSTGVIGGTAAAANSVQPGVQVTVTDASGATATTDPFRWIVTNLTFTAPSGLTTPYVKGCPNNCKSAAYSDVLDMTSYDNNGTGGNTYSFVGVTGGNAYYGGNYGDLSKVTVSSTGAVGSVVTLTMQVTDSSGAVKQTTFSLTTS